MAQDGKLIYYREAKPFGIGGLIIQGNPGYFVLKKWDTIEVWSVGKPIADTLIKMTVQGCDILDEVCQPTCTYKKICDPACDDGEKHDITCNIACIDANNNGIDITDMEARVAEKKCNPDCYGNVTNPFKAYDPGCVWKYKEQHDDICDPNSNGVIDGVCDPDCIDTKSMCDFDCNGTVYAGNPMALKDEKCFVCDETCNGWCSPACGKNAVEGMSGYDPDCRKEIEQNFWCSGDGLCEDKKGENCEKSDDCKRICDEQSIVCCPKSSDSDYAGCSATKDLSEGSACGCDSQCGKLKCDETKHCCPGGKTWNGTACELKYTFNFLFIQLNSQITNFKQKAESGKNLWVQITPLSRCPDKVRAIADDKVCSGIPDQQALCDCFMYETNCGLADQAYTQTLQRIESCAKEWGYDGKYTRVEGVLPGTYVCTVQNGGIQGYTNLYDTRLVSSEGSILGTSSHEMGHTYGLCDEPYGIERSSSCPNGWKAQGENYCCPNAPDGPCIMCSFTNPQTGCNAGSSFAQDDYRHLELELINRNKYCG